MTGDQETRAARLLAHLETCARAAETMPSNQEMADALGFGVRLVDQALRSLEGAGLIQRVGGGHARRVVLVAMGVTLSPRAGATDQALLAELTDAARAGVVTPTLTSLRHLLGLAHESAVSKAMVRLQSRGDIRIEDGSAGGRQRRIWVASIDAWTKPPASKGYMATGPFGTRAKRSRFEPTTQEEREAMLARFRAQGREVTRCPDAYLATVAGAELQGGGT